MDRRLPPDPEIRAFPRKDDAFQADVQQAIANSRATILDGARLLEAVRRDLAARYPKVRIEVQEPIASLGGEHRWYVYRDGKIA